MNRLIVSIVLALLLLAGCESATDDMGVVARVNGKPISLSQLEFQHDLLHMDGVSSVVPSVEALRQEYGNILGELIVMELVEQELERRGLEVTDEEMAEEEAKVRADYPEGAFEQVLVEEYIDLASWRRQLRYEKSRQKFYHSVLRPLVKVDYLEADAYYKDHIKDFLLPESYRLVVMRAAQKDNVQEAVALYRESGDVEGVRQKVPAASVIELTVSAAQLSQSWKDALATLPVGEASPVLQSSTGLEALVLVDKKPSSVLGPTQAYPLVEEALLDTKLAGAFEAWLAENLKDADIKISAHLLEKSTGGDEGMAGMEVLDATRNAEQVESQEPYDRQMDQGDDEQEEQIDGELIDQGDGEEVGPEVDDAAGNTADDAIEQEQQSQEAQ